MYRYKVSNKNNYEDVCEILHNVTAFNSLIDDLHKTLDVTTPTILEKKHYYILTNI